MRFLTDPAYDLPQDVSQTTPSQYVISLIPGSQKDYLLKTYGHIFTQRVIEKDFEWQQHDFFTEIEGIEVMPYPTKSGLALHFMKLQSIKFRMAGNVEGVMQEGWYMLFYVPSMIGHKAWLPKGHSQSQHINLDVSLVEELATKYVELLPLVEHAKQGVLQGLHQKPARMDYAVRKILDELQNCPEDSIERRYFIISRILTLLLFYVRDMGSHSRTGFTVGSFVFQAEDVDKLYRAQDILLSHDGAPLTIKELSLKVTMNISHLKAGYKHLFNTTIYHSQQTRRMKKAAELLLSTTHSIPRIAEMLAFEHPNAFGKAFKKHFSITPLQYRKEHS